MDNIYLGNISNSLSELIQIEQQKNILIQDNNYILQQILDKLLKEGDKN